MKKVDHIMHLEDLLLTSDLYLAPKVLRRVIRSLESGFSAELSVKFDGSPSILAGKDPVDNKFFVATKSIFNKEPVVYKSLDAINLIEKEGLRYAMWHLFVSLYNAEFSGAICQGDLMWTPDDLVLTNDTASFRTNTLWYSTKERNAIDAIAGSYVGVAWHTTYTAESCLKDLRVIAGMYYPEYAKGLVSIIPSPHLRTGQIITAEAAETLHGFVDFIEDVLPPIAIDEETQPRLKKFLALHQARTFLHDEFLPSFVEYLDEYYLAETNARKSLRGKEAVNKRHFQAKYWTVAQEESLWDLYQAYKITTRLKELIINQLDADQTFAVSMPDGRETGQEGYVFRLGGFITKLVNRRAFTVANQLNNLNNRSK